MFFKGKNTKVELCRTIAKSANSEQVQPSELLRYLSFEHQMFGIKKTDFVRHLPENPYTTMYVGVEEYKYIGDVDDVLKQILRNEYINKVWHLAACRLRDGDTKLDALFKKGHFRTWEYLEEYIKENKMTA